MAAQQLHGFGLDGGTGPVELSGEFVQEMVGQQRDVSGPFPQRRRSYCYHIEAVVKVFSEFSRLAQSQEVTIGRCYDAHIYLLGLVGAKHFHLFLLNSPQQAGLYAEGSVADFIQKNSTAISGLKEAGPGFISTCERAFYKAKQLAFQQRFWYCSTIDRHEGALFVPAAVVDSARHEFFAGATLPVDEGCHFGVFHPLNQIDELFDLSRLPDDAVKVSLPWRRAAGLAGQCCRSVALL